MKKIYLILPYRIIIDILKYNFINCKTELDIYFRFKSDRSLKIWKYPSIRIKFNVCQFPSNLQGFYALLIENSSINKFSKNLHNIKYISLHKEWNSLNLTPIIKIENFGKLHTLIMYNYNKISSITKISKYLHHLEIGGHNIISKIPLNLNNLHHLEICGFNTISKIPLNLNNLHSLHIGGNNQIYKIPEDLQICVLNIGGFNTISKLPSNLGKLYKLTLTGDNTISKIPKNVKTLYKLRIITSGRISSIPSNLGKLHKLTLIGENVNISNIPKSLKIHSLKINNRIIINNYKYL